MTQDKLTIAVIEDEPSIRDLIVAVLERAGHEVLTAEDGQAGLELLEKTRPDVLLCDLMIPRVHGYEVIRRVRQAPGTQRLPIIVLSAKAYASDQRKALEIGGSAFLAKPFRPQQLTDLIDRIFHTPRVRFWGVRGSIAAPGPDTVRYGGNTPCATVEWGKHTLVLDSGTGARRLGMCLQAEARGMPLHVHMLITHTHWDHIQGFPFFVPAFVPGNRVDVYGPPSAEKPLEKVLRGQMDMAYFPVALGDMAADIRVTDVREPEFEVGPFRVRAQYVNHPGVTMAYRITAGDKVITYATDTEPFATLLAPEGSDGELKAFANERDDQLRDLLADADLYIADSQYTPAEYGMKRGWGHTCYLDAVQMGIDSRCKRIVLFSHDPMHTDDDVDAKVEACRAHVTEAGASMEVLPAVEGEAVALADSPAE